MIPKEAFIAIASIMVIGWVFGIVCDKLLTRWTKTRKKLNKTFERRSCDTCRYEYTNPNESPCKECADDDIDLWAPADFYKCDTCRYADLPWRHEPCDSCTGGNRWEMQK